MKVESFTTTSFTPMTLDNQESDQLFKTTAESVPSLKPQDERDVLDPSKEYINHVTQGLNKFLEPSQTALKFKLHEELKEYYVELVDERTKEVIREIPPKKLLDMYAEMTKLVGLFMDKKI